MKVKIKNPVLRAVAGAVIFILNIAVAVAVLLVIFYGIGRLVNPLLPEPLFGEVFAEVSASLLAIGIGAFTILVTILVFGVLVGLYLGGRWIGERAFNSAPVIDT